MLVVFFFNDTATTEIYTLSLHDALPIGHVAVGAIEAKFWAELLELLAITDFPAQMSVADWPAMRATLADVFAAQPQTHWAALFEGTDACVTPVLSIDAAAQNAHMVAREVFSDAGPQAAPRLSRTPGRAQPEIGRASWRERV